MSGTVAVLAVAGDRGIWCAAWHPSRQTPLSCFCRNRVLLLNLTTDVINFWQDEETKHTIDEAKEKYPAVQFQGN